MKNVRRNRALVLGPCLILLVSGCLMPAGWENMHWSVYPQQAGDPSLGANPQVSQPYPETAPQAMPGEPMGEPAGTPPASDPSMAAVDPGQATLYDWNGNPIEGPATETYGSQATPTGRPRGVEPPLAGRMHIIELYQQVLDERDALAEEVETLTLALRESQSQHQTKDGDQEALLRKIADLEGSLAQMRKDFEEMGARLTTAQIRRLEAEKLLLEARIGEEKRQQEQAGSGETP